MPIAAPAATPLHSLLAFGLPALQAGASIYAGIAHDRLLGRGHVAHAFLELFAVFGPLGIPASAARLAVGRSRLSGLWRIVRPREADASKRYANDPAGNIFC